jgi:hypothetical protein
MFGLICGGNIVVLDYLSLLIDGTVGTRVKLCRVRHCVPLSMDWNLELTKMNVALVEVN